MRSVVAGLASAWSAAMLLLGQAQVNAELTDLNSKGMVTVRWEAGFWIAFAAFGAGSVLLAVDVYRARSEFTDRPVLLFAPLDQALLRTRLAIGGGTLAVAGTLMIVAGCVLPYIHYSDQVQPPSLSILNPGDASSTWFAAEPIGVAGLALFAAAALVAWRRTAVRAITSSVLLAFGVQTFLLFVGYVELAVKSPDAQLTPGGVIGMIGGVCLFAGGLIGILTLFPAPVDARPVSD